MDYNVTYRKKDKGIQVIISYKTETGKWKQKSKQGFPDTREGMKKAKIAADAMLQELKTIISKSISSEFDKITFKEFKTIHEEHMSLHCESSTIRSYKLAFNHFSDLDNIVMSKVKTIDIQKCIDKLIKKGIKSSTIKTYFSKIKSTFKVADEQYNLIIDNPLKNIKLENDKRERKQVVLSSTELNSLLNHMKNNFRNDHYYIVTLLCSKCGLRIGEVLGLRWSDIDFNNNFINIENQWKINKDGKYSLGTPKSKNSIRSIPIPSLVLHELIQYRNNHAINFDNRILHYKNKDALSINMIKEFKKLGLNNTIHDLRHTYATNLIANGIDFKTAAKILGHDIEMTMRVYSHVTDEMMKRAGTIIECI